MEGSILETRNYKLSNFKRNLKNVVFLNKKDASFVLMDDDEFYSSLSPFDRASRYIGSEDAKTYYGQQTLDWEEWMVDQIKHIFEAIDNKMEGYHINFPDEVQMILTTGKEEGLAAYCRKNAIILTEEKVNWPYRDLEYLINHELFHIYSYHNPDKQWELYEFLGFHRCPRISYYPEEIKHYITNPDTFRRDCYIQLNGKKYMPIIYSPKEFGSPLDDDDRADWRGPRKELLTFFDYITFGLIEIEVKDDKTIPILKNNKLTIYDEKSLPEYLEKVGRNTDYFVHPEETLADNFRIMINHWDNRVKDTKILVKMREIMSE